MLGEVAEAVQADFTARSITCKIAVGLLALKKNDPPPRIVLISRGSRSSGPFATRGRTEARNIWMREMTVSAHIWAASYAACEALLEQLIQSFHKSTILGPANYTWQSEEPPEGDGSESTNGREVLIATFQMKGAIRDIAPTTVRITSAELDGAIAVGDTEETGATTTITS